MVMKKTVKKTRKKRTQSTKTAAQAAPKVSLKSKIEPFEAVIFDIDNVLIDTRKSYLEAIRWTIDIYLTHGNIPFVEPNHSGSGPFFLSAKDIEDFKLLGGFNDDWDCCYGILVYLLNLPLGTRTSTDLKAKMNIAAFREKVRMKPLGVSGIVKLLGRPNGVTIEQISEIFQEVYLGKTIYEKMTRSRAIYWKKNGLIDKEKIIFRKSTFEKLRALNIPLGIATGRPRFEALYALKNFNALSYFEAMTTIDEVKKAERVQKQSLRKPHPFSLIETARKIGSKKRYLYIGDLPDDVTAANQAKEHLNICSVAFPCYAENPEVALSELKKAKPDFILKKPGDLPRLVCTPMSFRTEF